MEALGGIPTKEQDYAQAQGLTLAIIPYASQITWDLRNQQNAEITLTGNTTMLAPLNIVRGRLYMLEIIQDSVGSRTVSWASAFKNVSTLTLQTTATYSNILVFKGMSTTTLQLISNNTSTRA